MKARLFFLFAFFLISVNAQNWQVIGEREFTPGGYNTFTTINNNNEVFVAANTGSDTVLIYQVYSNAVTTINHTYNGYIVGFTSQNSSNLYLVIRDVSTSELKIAKYNGNTWSELTSPNIKVDKVNIEIDSNENIYLAFTDQDNSNKLSILKFDGSNWSQVGEQFLTNSNAFFSLSIDENSVPYIAFSQSNDVQGYVKKFNGTDWENFGDYTNVSTSTDFYFKIYQGKFYLGSNYDIYILNDSQVWEKTNSIISSKKYLDFEIDINGMPNFLMRDGTTSPFTYKFYQLIDGERTEADNGFFENLLGDDGDFSISASGTKYIFFREPTGCTVMRYSPVPRFTSFSISFVENNYTGIALDVNANNGFDNTDDYFVRYYLSGDDANLFDIDLQSGEITFKNPPDFNTPLDADTDNVYEVKVTAASTFSGADRGNTQDVQIYVVRDKDNLGNKWQQIGNTIFGSTENGQLGRSTSISANGKIMALGSPSNNENGTSSGKVTVYIKNNNTWELMGGQSSFTDATTQDRFGSSLDLSADGKTLIVGAPGNNYAGNYVKVFHYDGSSWFQKGNDLKGAFSLSYGESVSISDDGNIIAIGVPNSSENGLLEGRVRFYKYNTLNDKWQQFGVGIDNNMGGKFLKLSADGKTLITSHHFTDKGNTALVVYKLIDFEWKTIGYFSGRSIFYRDFSINEDGSTIAISENNVLKVMKYDGTGNSWTQIGESIDEIGVVSLSVDAKILTVADSTNYGEITSYFFNGTEWVQQENKIIGEVLNDSFGSSIQLSADGQTIVVGAPSNNTNDNNAGQVKVFDLVTAPVFESSNDLIVYQEKSTATVIDVNANDGGNGGTDSVSYELEGDDASLLAMTSSGVVTFKSPPEWTNPQDSNTDNIYEVTVKAINTNNVSKTQDLQIYVFPYAKEGNKWQQVGNTVEGDFDADYLGHSVKMSDDGLTTVVSLPRFVGTNNPPTVQVFRFDGNSWNKLGSNISVSQYMPTTLYSTDISADGNTIVIGVPASHTGTSFFGGRAGVFHFNGTDWELLGNSIERIEDGDKTGHSVSLSKDGKIVAVSSIWWDNNETGNPGSQAGLVRVFKLENNVWTQMGDAFKGTTQLQYFGYNVSLSADGKRIAITSQKYVGTQVFEWQNNTWVKMGNTFNDLVLDSQEDEAKNIKLNATGDVLALGFHKHTKEVNFSTIRIYKYTNNTWEQLGNYLDRRFQGNLGFDLDLSEDGTTLALGGPTANLSPSQRSDGMVKVYKLLQNNWYQIGEVLRGGESTSDRFGSAVNLNADGSRLIVGAPNESISGEKGYFKVYDLVSGKPIIKTKEAEDLTATTVKLGGNILSNGGVLSINERGVIYSLTSENADPTIDGANVTKKIINSGDEFSDTIENLIESSSYTFKAYAINSEGVAYGESLIFMTTTALRVTNNELERFVKIYPNPVSNILLIQNSGQATIERISIYDLVGKLLFHTKKEKFSIKQLYSGVYMLKINTNKGLLTKRIIKN